MAKSSKKKEEQKAPLEPAIEYVLTFDGQSNFITCPEGLVSASYTKEAWVSLSEPISTPNNILSGHQHAFQIEGGLPASGHNSQWGVLKDSSRTPAPANTWLHVAVTYDSQTKVMCLYRDGRLVGQADNLLPFNPDRTLEIGSHHSGNFFRGQMAEARIWNKALSQTEIQSNFSHRLVGNEPGLVAYWSLNEESGSTAHDKTSNAHHGIIHGNPVWAVSTLTLAPSSPAEPAASTVEPPSQPAMIQSRQSVLVLDGNLSGIAVGGGALRPQAGFTIEAWIYPATDAGKQVILAEGETLFYLEGGELKLQATPVAATIALNAPSSIITSTGAGITAGNWYHVAVTRAGSRPGATKLFINGIQNDNQAAIPPVLSLGNTYLGGQPDLPNSGFQGKLLEVRVWRFARSQSEIQANMTYFFTGRELGLIRCWKMNEGFGTTIGDRTTYRATGTIVGDATWEESEIPIKINLNAQERLTRSTGLEDYGYWFKEMAKQQKTEADPPFRRGRIWA